jgi:hypothetical protein
MGLHVALWGHSCPSVNLTGRVEGRRNKLAPTVAKFMAHLSSTGPVRCTFLCSSLVHHGHHCLHPMNKSWPSSARSSPRQLIAANLPWQTQIVHILGQNTRCRRATGALPQREPIDGIVSWDQCYKHVAFWPLRDDPKATFQWRRATAVQRVSAGREKFEDSQNVLPHARWL